MQLTWTENHELMALEAKTATNEFSLTEIALETPMGDAYFYRLTNGTLEWTSDDPEALRNFAQEIEDEKVMVAKPETEADRIAVDLAITRGEYG